MPGRAPFALVAVVLVLQILGAGALLVLATLAYVMAQGLKVQVPGAMYPVVLLVCGTGIVAGVVALRRRAEWARLASLAVNGAFLLGVAWFGSSGLARPGFVANNALFVAVIVGVPVASLVVLALAPRAGDLGAAKAGVPPAP